MCGIFGFLSGPEPSPTEPRAELFELLRKLTSFPGPVAPSALAGVPEDRREEALALLEKAQQAGYAWVRKASFLAAIESPRLAEELREAARGLALWTGELERLLSQASLTRQRDWELYRRLVIGGKDIAWQLEQDVLQGVASVRELVRPPAGVPEADAVRALGHAFELHLLLRSLGRLEVRGRDSAGVAIFVRFPGRQQLDALLDAAPGASHYKAELSRRSRLPALTHGALVRPATHDSSLLFVFKVAEEVGKMGDNVAFLRRAMITDELFQAALHSRGTTVQCLAHTRWASNGVISLANCHPVDSAARAADGSVVGSGELLAVLNGDVDNHLELRERLEAASGLSLDPEITTDAKIIPALVGAYYRESGDLLAAFRRAFSEFEGSMAIAVMAADRPGELLLGQKGSGQGLFFGLSPGGIAAASEMYGVVEYSPLYVKAEGERVAGGEIFRIRTGDGGLALRMVATGGEEAVPARRIQTAAITTRDINRGDKPHFFLKEIEESVDSVRRTIRGKYERTRQGNAERVAFLLGDDVIPPKLIEELWAGRVRRITVVGQGTAAVAGEGIAHLLATALRRARPAFHIEAMKATELSAHHLRPDMADTLVVAVSQSGTTTDTNRTVDMARDRGAWVLAIVNRRNSDLVYKAHGVIYTSDGRDIEMSVASTKAYYAQNVAGQVLALALGAELKTLSPDELLDAVRALEGLPGAMARTLETSPAIAEIAERLALRRRHWAVVGSGLGKVAANEIRIKLSELCYKSIAVDFIEDKKHIDLSSEPLIIACANSVSEALVSDLVKEVAIFKAHKSAPIVIADEDERRYDPYAAGLIRVPVGAGSLGFLLSAMVGHLFGYHAACASERWAERLRALRAEMVSHGDAVRANGFEALEATVTERALALDSALLEGALDGALRSCVAARLSRLFQAILGWMPLDAFARHHGPLPESALSILSEAIADLSRPVDAIKHQAKTVTVGISRTEPARAVGPLFKILGELAVPLGDLAETHRRYVAALEPLVERVDGATLYRLEGLDSLGRPTDASTIHVVEKLGCAASLPSRHDTPTPLAGTKWGIVKRGDVFMGIGNADGRRFLVVPVVGERPEGFLVLYHLALIERGAHEERMRPLLARTRHLDRLRIAVTERNLEWSDDLIDLIDNDKLFFEGPDASAEAILERIACVGENTGS